MFKSCLYETIQIHWRPFCWWCVFKPSHIHTPCSNLSLNYLSGESGRVCTSINNQQIIYLWQDVKEKSNTSQAGWRSSRAGIISQIKSVFSVRLPVILLAFFFSHCCRFSKFIFLWIKKTKLAAFFSLLLPSSIKQENNKDARCCSATFPRLQTQLSVFFILLYLENKKLLQQRLFHLIPKICVVPV